MALVRNVEKRIWNVEHFEVAIKLSEGRDVRGGKIEIPMYPFHDAPKTPEPCRPGKSGASSQTIPAWMSTFWTPPVSPWPATPSFVTFATRTAGMRTRFRLAGRRSCWLN